MLLYNKGDIIAYLQKSAKKMAFDWGQVAAAGLGGIQQALGNIGWKKKLKKQYDLQQQYYDYTAEQNYGYNEMAAENAHQRSLELQQNQFENASIGNQVAEAKEAGLSPSVFSNISGGSGGGGGGGAQGAGARGIQPMDLAALGQVENERRAINIDRGRAIAEAALSYAESNKIKAETENLKEQTDTSSKLTPVQLELTRQEGIQKWLENLEKEWKHSKSETEEIYGENYKNVALDAQAWITSNGYFSQEVAAEIAKIQSEVELNTEKQKQGWQELLEAARRNDIEEIKAKAIAMAAEFEYGETANWKWWAKQATNALGNIVDIINIGK